MQTEKVTFKYLKDSSIDFSKYGFSRISEDSLLFRYKHISKDTRLRAFYHKNFIEVSQLFYKAYELDSTLSLTRKNRLINLLKSIEDQEHMDVALLITKASIYFFSIGISEAEVVRKVFKEILPAAGFLRSINSDSRYVWIVNKNKKFKKGIGKAFVIKYIKDNFNADKTYVWLKKICFLKDGLWNYKNSKSKNEVEKYFEDFLKNGGICMDELKKVKDGEFEAFIPLNKDALTILSKAAGEEEGYPVIKGIASTTSIDREDERVSTNFISKMKKQAKGLPIQDNTHYASSARQTIGVIKNTGGDKNTFEISAKLMKRTDSPEVDFIMKQMELGIKYGFSIGGSVRKIFREFNEELQKEVYVLDDGELFHVALTTQPANAETFAEAISKCIKKDIAKHNAEEPEEPEDRIITDFKHNSGISKTAEPEKLDFTDLPESAFPKNRSTGEVFKEYPHHFIDNGVMYLHKGLLEAALFKAVEDDASKAVVAHLTNHLNVIGLSKKADEISSMAKEIDRFEEVQDAAQELSEVLGKFFEDTKALKSLNEEEKTKAITKIINEVGDKVDELILKIEKED